MRKSFDRAGFSSGSTHRLHGGAELSPARDPDTQLAFARRLHRQRTIRHRWPTSNGLRFSRTRSCRNWSGRRWRRTTICATRPLASRRRAPISESRGPINSRTWAPARTFPRFGSRGMDRPRCPHRSCAIAESDLRGSHAQPALVRSWTSGAGCAAPPKRRAPICWSAEENRKAVMTTLVSEVAAAYFSLRELDYQLEISQRTLATRQESLDLIRNRQSGGVATLLDLRQGEQLVYTASETIPTLQQQIEQTENQISLLLGKNPGEIVRGRSLDRTGDAARGARRFAFRSAGAPAGHSRGRANLDRRQCRDRRREGGLLSADQPDRISGRARHATIELVQRTQRRLEFHAAS